MMIGYYVRVSTLGAAWSASDTENLLTIVAPIHRPAVGQVYELDMMTPKISTFGATVVAVRLASFGRSFGATIIYS